MFKTIRAAGLAAAAAFLCTGTSAAASQGNDQVQALSAAAPVAPLAANAPAAAENAVLPAFNTAVAEHNIAGTALTPGRTRPDRPSAVEPAPLLAPGAGVTAAAGESDREAGPPPPLVDLVAMHSDAPISDEQFECLASAVYFESRGEPLEGQLAVAEVILNRVKSGRFRATICDVVKQPSQFSFVRRGVIPQAPRSSAAWARAVAIAHIALHELADVTGEESLFFHATYVNPRWGRPRVAKIGNHIFYR